MTSNISTLTNEELLANLSNLAVRERECTLAVILHLAELDKRKYYLQMGVASLFEYCMTELKYSESGAQRRITAARIITKYPEVYQMLKENKLTLATV
jgi:hypothetical protein